MAEQETYGVRLEKKIDSLSENVKNLSEQAVRLTETNNHQKSLGEENSRKIDALEQDVRKASGAVSLLNKISMICGGSVIAFCTWLVSSHTSIQQRLADTNQKVAILEAKSIRLDTDVAALSSRPPFEIKKGE